MKIEMGESLIYSWLRHIKGCQIAQENWKVSSQWTLLHQAELQMIKDKTSEFFQDKYGYSIYKKNASLSQIIQQGESDCIGVCIQNGKAHAYAVDVAFHESGLNYGSRQETVMKIINKSIRTSMCMYGYMDIRDAEIVFASPKIHKAIMDDVVPCIEDLQRLMDSLGYSFKYSLIANDSFQNDILQPTLSVSEGVADTNELFLRSYQMLKMFEGGKKSKK